LAKYTARRLEREHEIQTGENAERVYARYAEQPLQADLEARRREIKAQLPPAGFAAVAARGRSRQTDDIVAQLVSASSAIIPA
jgi:hypothetical protein